MQITIHFPTLLIKLSDVATNIAAFWFTAAFAVPIFSAQSLLTSLGILLLDTLLGIVFVGLSYLLTRFSQRP